MQVFFKKLENLLIRNYNGILLIHLSETRIKTNIKHSEIKIF